jgi:hypothetical protein
MPFTSASFELLARIHANPTKQFYRSHKEEFKAHVEEPFQRVLCLVAESLPSQVRALMETEDRLFSRFLKNDYGRGGAWDFYWGAFYTKGGRRSEGAQLYLCIDRNVLKYGFYIGVYADEYHERFTYNCRAHAPETIVSFDTNDGGVRIAPRVVRTGVRVTWESYLRNPYLLENDVCIRVPKEEVLTTKEHELATRIGETHVKLFPLVLLALYNDPLPSIQRYLSTVGLA